MKKLLLILGIVIASLLLMFSECPTQQCSCYDLDDENQCNRCVANDILTVSECEEIWCD